MGGSNMSTTLTIPTSINEHHYKTVHIGFIISYAKMAGIDVQFAPPSDKLYVGGVDNDDKRFYISCLINEHQAIFDFWDWAAKHKATEVPNVLYFKMQYSDAIHQNLSNVFPIGPMFILDRTRGNRRVIEGVEPFEEYFKFRKTFNYDCTGNKILNKQRIYGLAITRRKKVQGMLKAKYRGNVITEFTPSYKDYWKEQENCLAVVCVPGASENSLDRGQIESIGLGVCTISPEINISLPYNNKLIKDKHYIACKGNYSDLIEKIEWCKSNRKQCAQIGQNAKKLFDDSCLPTQHWDWIMQCVTTFYGEK